jgi:hypothetical protein
MRQVVGNGERFRKLQDERVVERHRRGFQQHAYLP